MLIEKTALELSSRFSEKEWQEVEYELKLQGGGIKKRKLELAWEEHKTFLWADNLGEDEEKEAIRCRRFPAEEEFRGDHASYLTSRHSFR